MQTGNQQGQGGLGSQRYSQNQSVQRDQQGHYDSQRQAGQQGQYGSQRQGNQQGQYGSQRSSGQQGQYGSQRQTNQQGLYDWEDDQRGGTQDNFSRGSRSSYQQSSRTRQSGGPHTILKVILGVVLGGILLIVLIACVSTCGNSDNGKSLSTDSNATGGSAGTSSSEDVDYSNLSIGQTVDFDGLKVTVNSVGAGVNQYSGGSTTVVNITMTNDSKTSKYANPYEWQLEGSTGVRSDPYIFYGEDLQTHTSFDACTLAAGGTTTVEVLFEGSDAVKVAYTPTLSNYDNDTLVWVVA